jgi:hypothetical protein
MAGWRDHRSVSKETTVAGPPWLGRETTMAGSPLLRRQTKWGEFKVCIDENLKLRGKEERLRGRSPVFI